MSEITFPDYDELALELKQAALNITPAELHGLLSGMLAGGLSLKDKSWQPLVFDYTNDGMGWPTKPLNAAETMLQSTNSQLTRLSMEFTLMLPESTGEQAVFDLADSVAEWVNHFISGVGLAGAKVKKASPTAKEALEDLEEIAKLGIDAEDDLEEQAELLEQVIEHVKACVLALHADFGVRPEQDKKPTLH
ncbi:YecA/YgfB family protein [Vibrio nitrifigilis]|uniref:UPF0149 protein I1A42_14190 n=1 Tax=Vibrio nitrifigilis TaxID=2789781 RepID=A0ABS0GGT5_9VIBR|nr:YecA family protein [Vibrio nitrifigilis]MBF9001646.1 YecA family protein [Vibrio nitrifigilis]